MQTVAKANEVWKCFEEELSKEDKSPLLSFSLAVLVRILASFVE